MSAPIIYRLAIEHFRCITKFSWHPAKGVNLILGGRGVSKKKILDAIVLLLSPTNPTTLADTDYHARNIDAGFVIEAIVSLPPESGINQQTKASWPWDWNGSEAVVPTMDGDGAMKGEPVYRLRVRGTEDLELAYEIVQPDGTADSLSVGLRRSIGLVRLSGDDRNDRDHRRTGFVHHSTDRTHCQTRGRPVAAGKLGIGDTTVCSPRHCRAEPGRI